MYLSDELRARLREVEPYPDGVAGVPEELPFTAFFPGGAGVILDEQGAKPPFPVGKVMIVGHNFYHLAGFELMRQKQKRDAGTPTWAQLEIDFGARGYRARKLLFHQRLSRLDENAVFDGRFSRRKRRGICAAMPRVLSCSVGGLSAEVGDYAGRSCAAVSRVFVGGTAREMAKRQRQNFDVCAN